MIDPSVAHSARIDAEPARESVRYWNEHGSAPMTLRSREEMLPFFDGLELLEPGVASCSRWRPEPVEIDEITDVFHFGGVARKSVS